MRKVTLSSSCLSASFQPLTPLLVVARDLILCDPCTLTLKCEVVQKVLPCVKRAGPLGRALNSKAAIGRPASFCDM